MIGKKCLSAKLVSGLYPSFNFGEYSLEVGPVFWILLKDGAVITHCFQLMDISEYHINELVNSELLSIVTNKSETEIKIGGYILRLNNFENSNYEHFEIFSHKNALDSKLIKEFTSNISDLTCTHISNTYGTTILIDFGSKNKMENYPFTVMVETSNWILVDNKNKTLTSSQEISNKFLQKLIGTKLVDIEFVLSEFSSKLIFDNSFSINTKNSGLDDSHWTMSFMDKHLVYGPKNLLGYTK